MTISITRPLCLAAFAALCGCATELRPASGDPPQATASSSQKDMCPVPSALYDDRWNLTVVTPDADVPEKLRKLVGRKYRGWGNNYTLWGCSEVYIVAVHGNEVHLRYAAWVPMLGGPWATKPFTGVGVYDGKDTIALSDLPQSAVRVSTSFKIVSDDMLEETRNNARAGTAVFWLYKQPTMVSELPK